MNRRTAHSALLFSAMDKLGLYPRTEPGRHVGRWRNLAGRKRPDISPTPPAPGVAAPGWNRVGAGLAVWGDEVEITEDAEERPTNNLTGLERAAWQVALANAYRPDPPEPPEPPVP